MGTVQLQRATMAIADGIAASEPPPPTARQDELTRRFRWYCATQYDHRSFNFDGTRRLSAGLREQIASAGMMTVDQLAQRDLEMLPWRYRHPSSPYHLARTITRRFTGLLFGADKHPTIECLDDQRTSEYAQGLIEASRLWSRLIEARNLGGAMGAVGLIFRFTNGRPIVSVLDPRWSTPVYRDRSTKELASLDYRYAFERTDPNTGRSSWWWYRRVITEESDVVFEEVPVDPDGLEPRWVEKKDGRVDHRLGFFPGVWIQNTHAEEHDDGDPDCVGIYDTLEEMDELLSASGTGAKAGSDPTVVIASGLDLSGIRTGSKTAIKLDKGETADYLEATGTGAKMAREQAMLLRRLALEVAQCVIEEPEEGGGDRTATEVDSRRQSMWDRASELREQYGEMGAKPIVERMIAAARRLASGDLKADDGRILKMTVQVPAMVERGPGGQPIRRAREPGLGTSYSTVWPPFQRPTPQMALAAAQAVQTARATNPPAIDQATATTYLANLFGGKDPDEIRARAVEEHEAALDASAQQLIAGMGETPAPGDGGVGSGAITLEEFEAGAFTIDEYRASRGFAPLPGGAGEQTVQRKKAPQANPIGAAPPTDQPAAAAPQPPNPAVTPQG